MKKFLYSLVFWGFFTALASPGALARDFFMYDYKDQNIRYMTNGSASFIKGPVMAKEPEIVFKVVSGGFLAVFPPETDERNSSPGQLVLYDAKGKRVDQIELGYHPFHWQTTKDRQHLFISFRKSDKTEEFVLLHYDTGAKKAEQLSNLAQVYDFKLSQDETDLLTLIKRTGQEKPEMTTLTYSPLQIKSSLPEHDHPQAVYPLNQETVATVSYDSRSTKDLGGKKRGPGSVRLINTKSNTTLAQYELPVAHTSLRYYEDAQTLLLICGGWHETFFGVGGFADIFKVTPAGIKYHAGKYGWTDFEYVPATDTLYLLTLGPFLNDHLDIIHLDSGESSQAQAGPNLYRAFANPYVYYYPYSIFHFPGSNHVIATCPQNGDIRFFDGTTNELLGETERLGYKPWWSSSRPPLDSRAVVSTNEDYSRYFVLSYVHNDIAVYDPTFKDPTLVPLPEPALGMYFIREPKLQTLVAGEQNLYKFDHGKKSLKRIAKFRGKAKWLQLFSDERKIIIRTDRELLVLNAKTLKVKQRFPFDQTSGKQVARRYRLLDPAK